VLTIEIWLQVGVVRVTICTGYLQGHLCEVWYQTELEIWCV